MKLGVKVGLFIVAFLVLLFALELIGLQWTRFFAPKRENIRREVFENTKSYTHGKIQDLSKYYGEYQKADNVEDKAAIASLIKMQFAEFDEKKINNAKLKQFLINTRGY